jgi:hypothetical protein
VAKYYIQTTVSVTLKIVPTETVFSGAATNKMLSLNKFLVFLFLIRFFVKKLMVGDYLASEYGSSEYLADDYPVATTWPTATQARLPVRVRNFWEQDHSV